MGGVSSKNNKLTQKSPLLLGSINFPAEGEVFQEISVDDDGYQAIPDEPQNHLALPHDNQADSDQTVLFNAVLNIIAAHQKKSREADSKSLDLFDDAKELVTLFMLNKHGSKLLDQNQALIQHFINSKVTLTQFKFEMHRMLRIRTKSLLDKTILNIGCIIGEDYQKPFIAVWTILFIGSSLGLTQFGTRYTDDKQAEETFTKTTPYNSYYDIESQLKTDTIGLVCFSLLLAFDIIAGIALCALDRKRQGNILANYNSHSKNQINQLKSNIRNKIDNLTEAQANTPRYREWFTLFVQNEKVNQPVAPYVRDDIEAQLALI